MNKIGLDFTKYVDTSFQTFMTRFLPLNVCVDILMVFLVEGTKIIFRYTYAILKQNKGFVKKHSEPSTFISALIE
jgi:hypothetical protein